MTDPAAALERAYREERAAVLTTLMRRLGGDLALAEDAVQDALLAAATDWPRAGVPARPGAWLTTTAWRKALDRIRRDRALAARLPALAGEDAVEFDFDHDVSSLDDDRLRLLFTCCHPALALEARIALTLRSVGGLAVDEIARALLVAPRAMEQRLVRARRKVSAARIPFRVPDDDLLPERLAGVLRVVYLIFNEGHTATAGPAIARGELCDEAIRLGRLLARLMPDDAETHGLLALLLLTDARRASRLGPDGDRTLWDRERIAEGVEAFERAARLRRPGPYQLQAAIAAVHAETPAWEETDWEQIAALYERLLGHDPSPVVAVNHAVAVAFAGRLEEGLALLAELDADRRLDRYQPFHAARAELLRRAGRTDEATTAYARAIDLTSNDAERADLSARQAAL